MAGSPYQAVWLVALFDLPTDTPEARKAYGDFRKGLLKDGFTMMQYSVYGRYCASEEKAKVHRRRISVNLPPDGEVRVVTLTDVQYGITHSDAAYSWCLSVNFIVIASCT